MIEPVQHIPTPFFQIKRQTEYVRKSNGSKNDNNEFQSILDEAIKKKGD